MQNTNKNSAEGRRHHGPRKGSEQHVSSEGGIRLHRRIQSGATGPCPPKRPKMAENRHISGHNKKINFYLEKFGLYCLVSSKEAKTDEFLRNWGTFFEIWPLPKPFGPLQMSFLDPPMSDYGACNFFIRSGRHRHGRRERALNVT